MVKWPGDHRFGLPIKIIKVSYDKIHNVNEKERLEILSILFRLIYKFLILTQKKSNDNILTNNYYIELPLNTKQTISIMKKKLTGLFLMLLIAIQSGAQEKQSFQPHVQIAPGKETIAAYPTIVRLADDRLLCVYSTRQSLANNQFRVVVVGIISDDNGKTWKDVTELIDASPHLSYDANIIVNGDVIIVSSTTVPPTHGSFVSTSRTLAVRSGDNGKNWSDIYEIPMDYRYVNGKCNPGITLADGTSMFPYAWDEGLQTKEKIGGDNDMNCVGGLMVSNDKGLTWHKGAQFRLDKKDVAKNAINGLDEPAIVKCPDGSLYMLFRTGFNRLYESLSNDGGKTWSKAIPSKLVCHNAPAALCEITGSRSGILAVWNNSEKSRWPLSAALSSDNGKSWTTPKVIAEYPGFQSSYPGCVQAADGTVVIVWQQDHPDRPRTIEMNRFSVDFFN